MDVMEAVWILARPITELTEWRRGAWQRLSSLEETAIVGCVEAVEEEGWRYEVFRRPPGSTLAEWFACHQAGFEGVEALVRQLGDVLRAIHAQGVVHLSLSPETIYVDSSVETLRIVVGGLHEATLYTQSTVQPGAPDLLYAPPEAAGRESHPPGTGLCAWDWWSVGRILQQFILGKHVVALLKPEVAKDPAALRAAAGALLLERDPPGMRAGAVEAMGPQDPLVKTLLQGLLTSVREARWSDADVRRWLARETVRVHYELPARARLFVWKDRGYTVASAVEHFVQEEAWEDGELNLFAPDEAGTFAGFLNLNPEHQADAACLATFKSWLELPAWAGVPPAARRTVTAAVSWLALGKRHGLKVGLVVRGRKMDAEGLTSLLESGNPGDVIALFRALLEPGFLERLATVDAQAGAELYDLATLGGEALRRAIDAGWIEATDEDAHLRVLGLALESDHALASRLEKLRGAYVDNRDPALAHLLNDRAGPPWADIILAYTGERATRFGYITAAQVRRERLASLDRRLSEVQTALFWRRVGWLLRAVWLAGAPWPAVGTVIAVLLGVGGILAGRPGLALFAAFLVALTRLVMPWALTRLLPRTGVAGDPWRLCDGVGRCRREAERCDPDRRSLAKLTMEQRELEAQRAALGAEAIPGPRVRPLAGLGVAAGIMQAAAAVCTVWLGSEAWFQFRPGPDTAPSPASGETAAVSTPLQEPVDQVESGKFEYVDEGFGRGLRGPLEPWTLHAPAAPVEALPVEARVPARPAQTAHALVSIELLLRPYARNAVNALVAVRVPSTTGRTELMIFNGRSRRPLDAMALRLTSELTERTWYQYDRCRVVFLGEPRQLVGEISLAPP